MFCLRNRFTTARRFGREPLSIPKEKSTLMAFCLPSSEVLSKDTISSRKSATVWRLLSRMMSILPVPHRDRGFTSAKSSIKKSRVSFRRVGLSWLTSFRRETIRWIPLRMPTSAAFGMLAAFREVLMADREEDWEGNDF